MNPKITKLPGIPKPPADASPAMRAYLETLAEAIDIRLGRRGDPVDRAVTLRELINSGLAKELRANPFDPNNPADNPGFIDPTKAVITDIPLRPTNFTASGAYSVINCAWDFANYSDHAQTEIHSHTSNSLGDATLTGVATGRTYLDPVGSGVTRYYWIRHINTAGTFGPWNSTSGTVAQTAVDVAHLLNVLSNSITTSELANSLTTQLQTYQNLTDVNGNITARGYQTLANVNGSIAANPQGFRTDAQVNAAVGTAVAAVRGNIYTWSASGTYAVNEVVRDAAGKLYVCIQVVSAGTNDSLPTTFASPTTHWKLYGDMARVEDSFSKITQINLLDGNSTSASAQAIHGLNSILKDSSGSPVVSATNLSTMKTSVLNSDGTARASATQVNYLNAQYINSTTGVANNMTLQEALNVTASNTNGLRGQYTVKLDANGHVAGFGLANETTASGTNTSAFYVNADRFAILPDSSTSITAGWQSGTTYSQGDTVAYLGKLFQARAGSQNQTPLTGSGPANNRTNNAVYWDNLSTAPFTVQSSGTTIAGTYVPAGVYINSAMIKYASITKAQIGSVDADTIETGDLLVSRLLTAGEISTDKLNIGGSTIISTADPSSGVHFLQVGAISIDTAHIKNAAIETLKLAGNSVTVQDAAVQSSAITLGVGNSSGWTTIVTDTFNPEQGGFVATFTGQLTITDDSRADFRMKVNGTVQREWNTGMRADSGSDVEGEMSSVMGFAMSSTTSQTGINVTIEGKYYSGAASVMQNGCLTIDGSKR